MSKNIDIICTIGPKTMTRDWIKKLYDAGMTIARINSSHSDVNEIEKLINLIKDNDFNIPVLIDLPGIKIRLKKLDKPIKLDKNKPVIISSGMVNNPGFYQYLTNNTIITADDGQLQLLIKEVYPDKIVCESLSDGELKSGKGLNIPDALLETEAISEKENNILKLVDKYKIEYIGLSFVGGTNIIKKVKSIINNDITQIVAKIENKKGILNMLDIISETDGIMIDRGDLSAETSLVELPYLQKRIIRMANRLNKFVIIATELLSSMCEKPIPTKAEVLDIANSIFDGADITMLSQETAVGEYPDLAVKTMNDIITFSKKIKDFPKAVILAAGGGNAFGSLTADRPKCLLDVGGKTILEHQIDSLNNVGIEDDNIIVVTGMGIEKVEEIFNKRAIEFYYNPWHTTTNMLVSLWLARNSLKNSSFILLYGDIIFSKKILENLMNCENNIDIVVDTAKELNEEDEKIVIKNNVLSLHPLYKNLIVPKHKTIPLTDATGVFIGMCKFNQDGAKKMFEIADGIIKEGKLNSYFFTALEELTQQNYDIHITDTNKELWNDNDTLYDLKRSKEIFPDIS